MTRDFGVNQGLVEELYLRYCANPASVDEGWRAFFEALPPEDAPRLTSPGLVASPSSAGQVASPSSNGQTAASNGVPRPSPIPREMRAPETNGNGHSTNGGAASAYLTFLPPTAESLPFVDRRRGSVPPAPDVLAATQLQGRLTALINAYRVRGHLFADLDPLDLAESPPDELSLKQYGLDDVDPQAIFATGNFGGTHSATLHEIVARLDETYRRTIGVEFMHLEDIEARTWLQERMETSGNRLELSAEEQVRILSKLSDAEIFEQFLETNYKGAKRFSLEGAESVIPLLDQLVERCSELGVAEVVIGMAHRGRLNVLANIMEKNVREIFAHFEDQHPEQHLGRGDVKYHLGYSTDRLTAGGKRVHLTLSFNPSHLEFVNPVVAGRVRAKQDRRGDAKRCETVALLIHGDAAFVGQGVVAETLNLSNLDGYRIGGTIHVVINNQIGFTTSPRDARSTRYCTDIVRMLRCPVFHVNGEDPEAVAQVVRLATEFRQRFQQDVVIDMYCYRLYGHNETDEPRFTQPVMYAAVDKKETVRKVYVDKLVQTEKISMEQAEKLKESRRAALDTALREAREEKPQLVQNAMQGLWESYCGGAEAGIPDVATAVAEDKLKELSRRIHQVPEGFQPNPKIAKLLRDRLTATLENQPFDWGTAEALAFASLVAEGTRVRLSGQDARRGTFSHRHAVIYDAVDGRPWCPLSNISTKQGTFDVYDSALSEQGVLGFDYGFALDSPDALVIWEAQFGDFANSAQVIIDQFLVSSEDKWHRLSGLVLLLPHGFEGQGPEHSSARLERFLSLAAEDNIQVCNLTSGAQLFHCLRRQVLRPWRKPLVIMSPKSLLRLPAARSTLNELYSGEFRRIILDDPAIDTTKVRRVLLCSGKVYYDLAAARTERGASDVAIIRLEQLYPIRPDEIRAALAPYADGTDVVWVQEEPENMGAWFHVNARVRRMVKDRFEIRCVSRDESASPATGSYASHALEQRRLVDESFAG